MNWPIYLTTIGLLIAGAGFLHQLLVKRKEATIDTLTEKNKWLHVLFDEWFCTLETITKKANKVRTMRVSGRSEDEAKENMIAAYDERFIRGDYSLPNIPESG